jgi:hypothetical protein
MDGEARGIIENVRRVELDVRRGDIAFYGPRGELVWRIPNAYQTGLKVFSFPRANSKAKLVSSLGGPELVLEVNFPEPVTCEIHEGEVVCSK